jgi:ElaB/YqjD/DUF883 family membrane-anchored ribosome-binding protein
MQLNIDTRNPVGSKIAQDRVDGLKEKVGDALDRGKSGIADSAHTAGDSLSRDIARLHEDIAAIQHTLSQFAAEVGGEALKTARNVGSAAKSQVGDAAGDIASAATVRAKSVASKFESMTRTNPLGAIAATLLVGMIVGMVLRRGKA